MGLILELLRVLRDRGALGPGDAVAATGRPRYLVLAAFRILEELGLVDTIYSKGTHRVYKMSPLGERLLDLGIDDLSLVVGAGLESLESIAEGSTSTASAGGSAVAVEG